PGARRGIATYHVAVVGVPFDTGVSYRPGARFGPAHIRQSSRLLRPYNPALDVEPFGVQQVVDAGDITANPFNIDEAITQIQRASGSLVQGRKKLLTLGGDHTIALPLLRTMAECHGPVALVHFDAHLDTWDTYFGAPVTHGTPFRRAAEEGVIDKTASIHVGLRGPLYSRLDLSADAECGFAAIHCRELARTGVDGVASRIRERVGDRPAYVSIDVDVLDPAYAPGTGTPEAGGMSSRELLETIRGLAGMNLISADIVEVAPAYDHAEVTGIAAAHIAYELISALAPARAHRPTHLSREAS
ncbi:MAG: agmatinase, partial [Actinophytocola sp.]|nr:agmatinase [Actinophytocola sp.]